MAVIQLSWWSLRRYLDDAVALISDGVFRNFWHLFSCFALFSTFTRFLTPYKERKKNYLFFFSFLNSFNFTAACWSCVVLSVTIGLLLYHLLFSVLWCSHIVRINILNKQAKKTGKEELQAIDKVRLKLIVVQLDLFDVESW